MSIIKHDDLRLFLDAAIEDDVDIHIFRSKKRTLALTIPKSHSRMLARDERLRHNVGVFIANEYGKPEAMRIPPPNKRLANFLRELQLLPEITA